MFLFYHQNSFHSVDELVELQHKNELKTFISYFICFSTVCLFHFSYACLIVYINKHFFQIDLWIVSTRNLKMNVQCLWQPKINFLPFEVFSCKVRERCLHQVSTVMICYSCRLLETIITTLSSTHVTVKHQRTSKHFEGFV